MIDLLKLSPNRNILCNRIVHLFRILQRLNRFVTEDMNSELSIVESLLLYELDSDATRSVTEIAHQMELDKGTISRTLKNLADRKILKINKDSLDARRITIEITANGYKLLKLNDSESNSLLDWYLRFLTPHEEKIIAKYFKFVADSFGTAPSKLRKNDHPIRVELRRLAKSLGYLKNEFMSTPYSPAEWQILASIQLSSTPITPAFLIHILSSPPSFISRLLGELVKKGLIRRPRSSEDSRIRELYLSEKGKEAFSLIENSTSAVFKGHLKELNDQELLEFTEIFTLFVREIADGVRLISRDTYIQLLITETERLRARGFLLREAVAHGLEEKMPGVLCYGEQIVVGLYKDSKLCGVLLLDNQQGEKFKATTWFISQAIEKSIKDVLIEEACTLITTHLRGIPQKISIDTSSYIGNH